MCGISGVFYSAGARRREVQETRQRHRGPDDDGTYSDPHGRAELWFRRLAILDLSPAGHQPMCNEAGTVWLTFNGEIYNYRSLRARLEAKGHVFRSRTDSEVLVHLWEEMGREMVGELNGMFAFCIWDERTGEGFLARDHAGIKPLYLLSRDGSFAFASEAKVLVPLLSTRRVDPLALQQYLTFLWVPGERTMWEGIHKLPPGGWLSWSERGLETGRWWDWDQSVKEELTPDEWAKAVRQTLLESVEQQMMSDVPLGGLVSGGLDSSAIAGAMRALRPTDRIRAYTADLPGPGQDGFAADLPYAREVAAHLSLDLISERIEPVVASLLPFLVWHADEPLADPAIAASYILCRRAREDGTVVLLSGQGADELYHGYRSHRAVRMNRHAAMLPAGPLRLATAMAESVAGRAGFSSGALPRRVLKMLRFMSAPETERILSLADWGSAAVRQELLGRDQWSYGAEAAYGEYLSVLERSRARNDEERWSYVLFNTFLPALNLTYGDRTSMAASVELRVPFLDRRLVEQAGRIPSRIKTRGGSPKWVLGEASSPWLPPSIRTRPKTGFGAPLREWLSGSLFPVVRETLLGDSLAARGLFRRQGLESILRDLTTNRRDVAYIVWAVFTFEIWAKTFIDADGVAPTRPVPSRWRKDAGTAVSLDGRR